MQHWQCALCGQRSRKADPSHCSKSSGRLLMVHDWQDAFELARSAGVLRWTYESREQFLELQPDINAAGWEVEKVEEVRESGGPRLSLRAKPKAVLATLRFKAPREMEGWRPAGLLQSREAEPQETKAEPGEPEIEALPAAETFPGVNGNGHGNGHIRLHDYDYVGAGDVESWLPAEGDDLYEIYPEADDSAVY